MIGQIQWRAPQIDNAPNGQYNELREPRVGVMIHYDGSGTDRAALQWFSDPRCKVSYHYLVFDDGTWAAIAPFDTRAWHAGVCRSSDPDRLPYGDANSALVGIAAATNDPVQVTAPQMVTVAWLTWLAFNQLGWDVRETWRIVGHDTEAWPRRRKIDPTGSEPRNPVLAVQDVRTLVPLFTP